MCPDCFIKEISKFNSFSDFKAFEAKFEQKLQIGKLLYNEGLNDQDFSLFDSKIYYTCVTCSEDWILSIPDNAWRGYFLRYQSAVDYHNQLKDDNKQRSIGCISLIIGILIYYLIKH